MGQQHAIYVPSLCLYLTRLEGAWNCVFNWPIRVVTLLQQWRSEDHPGSSAAPPQSLLHLAARHGHPFIVSLLLSEGAEFDRETVWAALASKSIPVFQVLLDAGWDINWSLSHAMTVTATIPKVRVGRRVWDAIKKVLWMLQPFIDEHPLWLVLSPVWVSLYAFGQVIVLLRKLAGWDGGDSGDYIIWVEAKRVPGLFSGVTDDDGILALFAWLAIAMVFGGIHMMMIASPDDWSFQFPHTEQLLWRISSPTITCVPVLEMLSFGILHTNVIDALEYRQLASVPYIIARFNPAIYGSTIAPPRRIQNNGQLS